MTKMTVTEGLAELKTLDKRIEKRTHQTSFISYKLNGNLHSRSSAEEIASGHDSLMALIKRRRAIKAKVTASNALTQVSIAGQKMTVAEAIERKNSVDLERSVLDRMTSQYNMVMRKQENFEESIDREIEAKVSDILGNQKRVDPSDNTYKLISDQIRGSKTFEVVDPLKVKEAINKMSDHIDDFENNVDTALTISNSTTYIEV